ncbi:MAG TPA: TAT-variant-translocated molybdopterin oxidoreductase, partial [Pirellulales bacterium]|nr:TAT-variant-translocated molybdopterin oxidoreductase [Pirellulales bacterium]
MTCRPPDQSKSNSPSHKPAAFGGRKYWRSLEELADDEAFQRLVEREFPNQAMLWPDSVSRRKFLMLMGASLALGGIGGCSVRPAPSEDLVPYVRPPEQIVPGKPLFYATTITIGGDAVGLLVESHMGRPTKMEGNPQHPASLGGTSALHQASILSLYDPDRSQTVTFLGRERTWEGATAALRGALTIERERQGSGLRILTETVASPTLAKQLAELLDQYPQARWYSHEPIDRQNALRGAQAAFGEPLAVRYDLQAADVILSLDCDFLFTGPGHLPHAREFAARRRVGSADASAATMNRMYVVETAVTCTGAKADHRLAVRGAEIEEVARAVAGLLGMDVKGQPPSEHAQWLAAVADDLAAHRGRSLVIAGERQPPLVHMLAHLMNDHLGNSGQTVSYYQNPLAHPRISPGSLPELSDEMERGEVELLVILGGNPVHTASADVPFGKALERVPLRMHWSLFQDETSRHCQWHLPATHDLEAWSDAVAFDGTASIVQPLIEPLYQGRSAHEIVALISQLPSTAGRDIVRGYWREQWQQANPR